MLKATQPVGVTPKSHFLPEGRPGVGGQRKRVTALHSVSALEAGCPVPTACRKTWAWPPASSLEARLRGATVHLLPPFPPSLLSFLLIFFLPFY